MGNRFKSSIKFFVLVISLLLGLSFSTTLQKEYELIFFKFGPEDLQIKIYPENFSETDESVTDYIISKIENNSAHIFLVKNSPNERNFIDYRYRISFYKPQQLGKNKVNVPIYSFTVFYDDGDIVVKYEPSKSVPKEIKENNLEKRFKKSPGTNIYFLKDYDGEDFDLTERMRKVKFIGSIKNDNGTMTDILDDMNIKIKLVKVDEVKNDETSDGNEKIKKDYSIEVPLNQDLYIGLVPYKIEDINQLVRFSVKSIVIGGKESNDKFIHFAEIWDNMYEQKLIFKDDGYFLDFKFDLNLFDLEYSFDGQNFSKCIESPLSLSLKQYDGKTLQMNLNSKNYVVKYLKNPTRQISYDFNSFKRSIDAVKEINQKYFDITEINQDGSIYLKPDYKKTNFVIFSDPPRAKIKYKVIEPLSVKTENGFVELGEAPIYFNNLDFGIYSFKASWYEKDLLTSEIKEFSEEVTVEFSDPTSDRFYKNIKYLTKNEVKISYIEFFKNKKLDATKDIIDTIVTDVTTDVIDTIVADETTDKIDAIVTDVTTDIIDTIVIDVTTDIIDTIVIDVTTDKIDTIVADETTDIIDTIVIDVTTDKIDVIKQDRDIKDTKKDVKIIKDDKKENFILQSIKLSDIKEEKNRPLFIQIIAVETKNMSMNEMNRYALKFLEDYKGIFKKDFPNIPKIAKKSVGNRDYYVILLGPYILRWAKYDLKLVKRVIADAFIVSEKELMEYK